MKKCREKSNETSLSEEKDFYSDLKIEDITAADYMHAEKVCKNFEIKKDRGEYHDLYVQSDTLLLADAFENFRNTRLEVYKLHFAYFLTALELAWQAALENIKVKLDLLTNIHMLIMVEKGSRGGICHTINHNKYMKDYNNKKSSILIIGT